MTVDELIRELEQLPGAARQAVVLIDGDTGFSVDYSHGEVPIYADDHAEREDDDE